MTTALIITVCVAGYFAVALPLACLVGRFLGGNSRYEDQLRARNRLDNGGRE